jgi:KaiC/GvpD/RAD55 family RecA-like ATPase
MDLPKQQLFLSLISSNRDLMALCADMIKPSYFDPSLKKTVKFMCEYFKQYKDLPKLQTIRAETGVILEDAGKIERADIAYVSNEIEVFCRERAVTEAVIAGYELIQKKEFGKIIDTLKDAISVGLQKDIGINYFDNPAERLRQTLVNEAKISTGWPELDSLLGGGLGRQELVLFTSHSGGGKSMSMLNISRNLLAQGLNGVLISLEMKDSVVSKRMDSMISKIAQDNLLAEMDKVLIAIEKQADKMGMFFVKRMPENRTNIATIRSYLQQLEQTYGFRPDFIVVDYIDIMGTTMSVSHDNLFIKDKYVTEEVRSLGFDYDCIMISASQLGKHSQKVENLTQADVQGGSSKINTSDYAIAIRQDDLMRSTGEISFKILKSRNSAGIGQEILLGWDPISLRISSLQEKKNGLQLKKKSHVIMSTEGTVFSKPSEDALTNLMNIT